MKKIFLAASSFFSVNAFALGPLYVDLHASGGLGKAEIEKESKSPDTNQYGLGATVGWKIAFIYLGASADYYKVSQTTKPDNNAFGNRSGSRTNLLSPTVGVAMGPFRLKLDYQMSGEYKLDKKTSSNENVTYKDPTGYRGYLGYRLGAFTEIGAFYEKVAYATEVTGSTKTKLSNKLNISQTGLMFLFRF